MQAPADGGLVEHWQVQWLRYLAFAEQLQQAPLQPHSVVRNTSWPIGQRAWAVRGHGVMLRFSILSTWRAASFSCKLASRTSAANAWPIGSSATRAVLVISKRQDTMKAALTK
jgi:hypothetical protein